MSAMGLKLVPVAVCESWNDPLKVGPSTNLPCWLGMVCFCFLCMSSAIKLGEDNLTTTIRSMWRSAPLWGRPASAAVWLFRQECIPCMHVARQALGGLTSWYNTRSRAINHWCGIRRWSSAGLLYKVRWAIGGGRSLASFEIRLLGLVLRFTTFVFPPSLSLFSSSSLSFSFLRPFFGWLNYLVWPGKTWFSSTCPLVAWPSCMKAAGLYLYIRSSICF